MTKISYIDWEPQPKTLAIIETAEGIIDEYELNGYVLTLRQLYYQFVARGILENSERSYKNLGGHISKARMAGLISWRAIEDRNRQHRAYWHEENALNLIRDLPKDIRFDRWARQETYVEVWVEKEALGNVVSRACEALWVPHLSCKGYLSASEAWRAGQRFKRKQDEGKRCVLIHLGDHDPSGLDMTRDNRDRVRLFSSQDSTPVKVTRIALNIDQVEEYDPPPNPTKVTDSRAKGYIKQYGSTSWELDALEPSVMEALIQDEIKKYIDVDSWNETSHEEQQERDLIERVYDRWDEIQDLLE